MNEQVIIVRKAAPVDLDEIRRRLARPLREAGVERAVVFGSWARGEADGYSDLDLVIVMETERAFLDRGDLLPDVVSVLPIGVDLLIYTPEEFREGMRRGMGIFHAIAREGVDLYG